MSSFIVANDVILSLHSSQVQEPLYVILHVFPHFTRKNLFLRKRINLFAPNFRIFSSHFAIQFTQKPVYFKRW